MYSGELVIFVLHASIAALMSAAGVPLSMGWVPPNPLYGYRTPKTQDPRVWYPVNRVAGHWLIVTGIATAGVAALTYFCGLEIPAQPLVNLIPIVLGLIATVVHGIIVAR